MTPIDYGACSTLRLYSSIKYGFVVEMRIDVIDVRLVFPLMFVDFEEAMGWTVLPIQGRRLYTVHRVLEMEKA